LRSYLQGYLPTYMIPSAFIFLEILPLTPNGKVDLKALPAPTWERAQDDVSFRTPRSASEKMLATIWEEVLHIKDVSIQDNFFERGGDSIMSIQIIARASQQGLRFTLKQLFQYQTIEQLSTVVDTKALVQAEQGLVLGPLPLTPIQQWFFELDPVMPHHWNQTLFFEVTARLRISLLEEGVKAWLRQHDALRLRFHGGDDGLSQSLSALEDPIPCVLIDLSALDEEYQERVAPYLAGQTQASLDLGMGPLVRVVLFERGSHQAQLLLLVIHHLAVDGVSWRILLEDLQLAYQQVACGEGIVLPAKTSSFKEWAEHLVAYAHSPQIQQAQRFWQNRNWVQTGALPRDGTGNEQGNTIAYTRTLSTSLSIEETSSLLAEVPAAYHTQINEVLLTALAQTLTTWMGISSVLIDLEGHGREDLFVDLDISRTVGWFTSLFPVYLTLGETLGVSHAIQRVKEHLRAIPNHGIDYGILRYLSTDHALVEQLQAYPQAEVSFNYLGQVDQTGKPSRGSALIARWSHLSAGSSQSEQGSRSHLLDIICQVSGNQFQATWRYQEGIHRRSTIEGLATAFLEALRQIIHHCQSPDAGSYTPADFAEVQLSQKQIELVMKELNFAEEIADE
jgi:non-ribosomal peptide synthase protein (TIGR01720 family)